MKRILSLFLSFFLLFFCFSCGGDDFSVNIVIDEGYMRYDVSDRQKTPIVGFGAQMDTDIFMPWNNLNEEDEEIWESRIRDMNLKYTRIKYYPEMFERANDNDDPDIFDYAAEGVDFECAEMQALYKILDICQKYDIKVDLGSYNCYNWFESYDGKYEGSWLGVDTSGFANETWTCGPSDFDEYAENISVLLQYLINDKGYTCIWGFSHIQEAYVNAEGASPYGDYVECVKKIDARLRKDGIRDKIKLIYSGSVPANNNLAMMKDEVLALKGVVDAIGTASYPPAEQLNETSQEYYEELSEIRDECGLNYIAISEFCEGGHFLDAVNKTDIDSYEAGITVARLCVNAASRGVTAFSHYILGDTMFTNAYIHTMGLWNYKEWHPYYAGPLQLKEEEFVPYAAHPEYYFYGMICKYTDTGSYAYKVETDELSFEEYERGADICAVAFKLPDGAWTYILVNKGHSERKVAVVNTETDVPSQMNCYKITADGIPADRKCVLPDAYKTVNLKNGAMHLDVPANGMIVVSNKTFS